MLSTNVVQLKPIEKEDAEEIAKIARRDGTRQYLKWNYITTHAHPASEFIEDITETDSTVPFKIEAEGTLAGAVLLTDLNRTNRTAEVCLFLLPNMQDQGYGSDALTLISNYAFNELDLRRLQAISYETSTQSQSLLTSNGFTQEGQLKEYAYVDGEYVDGIIYGLLQKDYSHNVNASTETKTDNQSEETLEKEVKEKGDPSNQKDDGAEEESNEETEEDEEKDESEE